MVADALKGPADLAIVFAAGAHLAAAPETLAAIHEALAPAELIGCGAGGVLAGDREVEDGTAIVVWAATLDEGSAQPFHAEIVEVSERERAVTGMPDLAFARGVLLLPDAYTFPTGDLLRELAQQAPGVPVLGGVSSGRTQDGGGVLFYGEEVATDGAVGLRLDGIEMLACVSQGAAPVGPELTVTAAEGHVIQELAGEPALRKLREVLGDLPAGQRERVAEGPLVGLVIDGGKPDYHPGDFLVRGLVAANPRSGAVSVGTLVREGQVVRLQVRDADSADRDLRAALALRHAALGGEISGALMFTCNARGRGMFGTPDHDATIARAHLGDIPCAGFFAAGEIGPVGGENHLHSFTATLAIFA